MSAPIKPIHVEAIGLANIRFFRPPSGCREFPFVSIHDLYAAMAISRGARRAFDHDLRASPWRGEIHEVTTTDGAVTIVPHYQAQDLIQAMADVGRCQQGFYLLYAMAGTKALGVLTGDMHGDHLLAYIKAAVDQSNAAKIGGAE